MRAVGVDVEFVIKTEVVFAIGVTIDEADEPVGLDPCPLNWYWWYWLLSIDEPQSAAAREVIIVNESHTELFLS